MLPGYNHNIKYKEHIYHVQTEDSGVQNPHIITHLFFGGNIIFSIKTSYVDIVHSLNLNDLLVDLMQVQHKNVLKDLIRGKLDSEIAVRSKNAATLNGPAPLNIEAGAQHRASSLFGHGGSASVKPAAKPAAASPMPSPSKGAPPRAPVPTPQQIPVAAAAVAEANPASSFFGSSPPAKIIEASTLEAAFDSKDDKAVDSIFGNLISEKSLDEVILSYLADDSTRDP